MYLVLTDLSMPGMSGVELLRTIRSEYPDTSVVLVTAFGTVESAVEAMWLGAYDYITKPVNPDSLRLVVGRALEHLSLREETQSLRHLAHLGDRWVRGPLLPTYLSFSWPRRSAAVERKGMTFTLTLPIRQNLAQEPQP
jgi:DNA-binding NtrC family response regulator